jgi:hypothetical protein
MRKKIEIRAAIPGTEHGSNNKIPAATYRLRAAAGITRQSSILGSRLPPDRQEIKSPLPQNCNLAVTSDCAAASDQITAIIKINIESRILKVPIR